MLDWWDDLRDEAAAELRAIWLRRCWAAAMLLLMAVTARVWVEHGEVFPQVPIIAAMAWIPAGVENALAGGMVLALVAALLWPGGELGPRVACGLFAAFWAISAAGDYQRLQPWAWQGALLAVLFAAADARSILAAARWITVGIYVHSAVSKCDASFLHTLGMQFAQTLTGFVGLDFDAWPPQVRLAVAGLFPAAEMLAGVLLALPFRGVWRWIGLGLALTMHLALLAILGPLGLDHRAGVLLWNLFFIAQDLLLFWPLPVPGQAGTEGPEQTPPDRSTIAGLLASYAVLAAAIFWPFLVLVELCDPWLAWGLYSSSASRVLMAIPASARDRVPAEWQHFLEGGPDEPALRVRLDRAALGLLGTPIYPHARPQLGIAESLARRWDCGPVVQAELLGPSDRFLPQDRTHEPLRGVEAMKSAAATRFRLNARAGDVLRP